MYYFGCRLERREKANENNKWFSSSRLFLDNYWLRLLLLNNVCLPSHCAFQGNGVWVTNNGKRVQLRDVFLPSLTEVERLVLEKQAQEKILQLGVTLTPQGWFACQQFECELFGKVRFYIQKHHRKAHRSLTKEGYYYLSEKQSQQGSLTVRERKIIPTRVRSTSSALKAHE